MPRPSSPSWDELHRDSYDSHDEARRARVRTHHVLRRIVDELEPPAPKPPLKKPVGKNSKLGRYALGIAAGLGLSVTFVSALVGSLLLHIDLPASRRAVAHVVTEVASGGVRGRIELEDVRHIGLFPGAIDVGRVTIRDPAGNAVIVVRDTTVDFHTLALVKGFLSPKLGPATIDHVTVGAVDVALIDDGSGSPTLPSAFTPKKPSPPSAPKSDGLRIALRDVDLARLSVQGKLGPRTIDARGDLHDAAVYLEPDGTRVVLPSLGLDVAPIEGATKAPTRIALSTELRIPSVSNARFPGVELRGTNLAVTSGGVVATVTAELSDGHVDAHLLARATPDDVAPLLGGGKPPLWTPVVVSVDAHGTLDLLDLVADVTMNRGRARVRGRVDLAALSAHASKEIPRISLGEATVMLDGIDARAFAPTAPALVASAAMVVRATATEGGTELAVIGARKVPDVEHEDPFVKLYDPSLGETFASVDGKVLLKNGGGLEAKGSAHVAVERTKTDVDFHLDLGPSDAHGKPSYGRVDATVHASAPALSELRFVHLPVAGSADLDLTAHADLVAQTFTATGAVRAREIHHPSVNLPSAVIDLSAQGTFSEPQITAKLTAPEIYDINPKSPATRKPKVHDLVLDVLATKRSLGVQARFVTDQDQTVSLTTSLSPTPKGLRVSGLTAHVQRDLFVADLQLKELDVEAGNIAVKGLRLATTAGGIRLDGSYAPMRHEVTLDVATTELDLNELAYGLGFDLGKTQAKMQLSGTLKTVPRRMRPTPVDSDLDHDGILQVSLDTKDYLPKSSSKTRDEGPALVGHFKISGKGELEMPPVVGPKLTKKFEGSVDVDIDDRLVEAGVDLKLKDVVEVTLHGGAALAGRFDDVKAWRDAVGHLDVSAPDVDLEKVNKFVAQMTGKSSGMDLQGNVSIDAMLTRPDPKLPPLGTLAVIGRKVRASNDSFALDPVDFALNFFLRHDDDREKDEAPDMMDAALTLKVNDKEGALIDAEVVTEGSYSKFVDLSDGSTTEPMAKFLDLPVFARIDVPTRPLEKMPAIVRQAMPVDGKLGVALAIDGTLGQPLVALDVKLDDVKTGTGKPHELALHTTYDGKEVDAKATVVAQGGGTKTLFSADAVVTLDEKDLLGKPPQLPWTAKLDAKLDGLPLGLFSALAAVDVSGVAYGEVHVDHVNDPSAKAASAKGKIDIDALTLGDSTFDKAIATFGVDDKQATANLVLEGQSGSANADVAVPLVWKDAKTVALDPNGAIKVALKSKDFRLRFLEPFVTPLDQLDGFLDADVKADVKTKKDGKGGTTIEGGATGTLHVHDGIVVVGAIGERYQGINADVTLSPNKVELKKLELHGLTGDAMVTATVTLDQLIPKTLHVDLDANRFPFATNGVPVGSLSGRVVVDGKFDPEMMSFDVTIDPMTVDLAAMTGKHPQPLEDDPSIVIAEPVEKPEAPKGTASGTPMKISVNIPNDIIVRREDLQLFVRGNPSITVRDAASFQGEVIVNRGWVDVFGKRFVVDHAKIRFDGGSELDPVLDIAVKWQAPDGSDVKIAVTNRLSQPKIVMTADPSATQAEIMSLLVIGRRDAGSASQQEQAQRGAAAQTAAIVQGMTGAILGQQLQKMLPTSMTLSFQPGDAGFSDARYATGYQWRNVYFEVGYNAGSTTQQVGTAASTPQAKTTFGVEWRFKPMWSLITTLGDTGSALVDLLWHYRY